VVVAQIRRQWRPRHISRPPVWAPLSAYTEIAPASPVFIRSTRMSKARQTNKEPRKQALLTSKEKKAVKRAKKNALDTVPFLAR
jgi:hypothetical protein